MKTDLQIQKDVIDELKWQPFLQASDIGVSVRDGIVTLSGNVDFYTKKILAEKAVRKVAGVKAIAEDIQVGVSPAYRRSDADIAAAVLEALKWHSAVQEDRIKIKVEDGVIKLEGEVEWDYQRRSIHEAVDHLSGVTSVINLITIKPIIKAENLEKGIRAAFHRHATIDAAKINVAVDGAKVTLTGHVRSLAEKEDAENAAWAAPGVFRVDSHLEVNEPEIVFES